MILFSGKKCKVVIKNLNVTVEVKSGSNLYNVLIENGVTIPTLCKGNGQCGKCRVRIVSLDKKPINKPTKKDSIILAPINIDAGFRLACQYDIKSDIIVDVSDFISRTNQDGDIVAVRKKGVAQRNEAEKEVKDHHTEKQTEPATEKVEKDQQDIDLLIKPQVITLSPKKKIVDEQDALKKAEDHRAPQKNMTEQVAEDVYEPVNGVVLIQFPGGIKSYIYSPTIDNILSENFIKTDDRLERLFKDALLNDFIFNTLKATDIQRVILILDENVFQGDILLNLVSYVKSEQDGIFYELVQPCFHPKNLLSFFRQIANIKDKTLTIPLDNLSDCFYSTQDQLVHLNGKYVVEEIKISNFLNTGKNPLIDISSDLNEIILKDSLLPPDSILFPAFLKLINILKTLGIVDQYFNLKSRNELIDKIPLELLVKLSFRNEQKLFNIFRSKDTVLSIGQKELDAVNNMRVFIHTLCSFVEMKFGKIDNLNFHTISPMETVVNELVNLNIVPQKYAKRCKLLFGDPTVNCIKLFNYRDIPAFIHKNFGNEFSVYELYKNEDYNSVHKELEKEFLGRKN